MIMKTKEKQRIKAAAKILQKVMQYDDNSLPYSKDLSLEEKDLEKMNTSQFKAFHKDSCKSKIKQTAIVQCIISTSIQLSALLPIPFGIGVEMDHVFGPGKLVRLGLSISADEVTCFKKSALA